MNVQTSTMMFTNKVQEIPISIKGETVGAPADQEDSPVCVIIAQSEDINLTITQPIITQVTKAMPPNTNRTTDLGQNNQN